MRKCKLLLTALVAAVMLLAAAVACAAETDPIVCAIELNPDKLSGPGKVAVTITISNSGSEDMRDPVVLHDPATQVVADFGTNGSAILKAGESKTWTGEYEVSQRMLDGGAIVYYAKYNLYTDSGEAVPKSQSIRGVISAQTAETGLSVRRTITPTAALEGQEITVKYEIQNSGTVSLTDITIQENKDIYSKKQTIPELKAGQIAEIKYPVKMGKKDLTSGAKITYKTEGSSKSKTYTVEDTKIIFGESSLVATLTSSSKGVPAGNKIKLTLTLKNKGSVAVSDIRVSDPTLGEVFAGQEVAAGKTLTLEKEITLTDSADYTFTAHGTDATGSAVSAASESVSVTAVDPGQALTMEITATPDKTEVFESPGLVRFTLNIANTSAVDAVNVTVKHGDSELYTFDKIPAGETRRMTRDTALSMPGKYRFSIVAKDPLDNSLTFESNEIQIAFSVPTPAPATQTPAPDPTAEPTFMPVTMPPITDASIGAVPKTVQSVLLPILIAAGVLFVASGVLLIIATKRRAEQRKAAEAALDHLERAKRRDYVTPAEDEDEAEPSSPLTSGTLNDDDLPEYDLPPIEAVAAAKKDELGDYAEGLYDEEMTSDLGRYADISADSSANDAGDISDAEYESDGYTEGLGYDAEYSNAGYADDTNAGYNDAGYADDTNAGYSNAGYADDASTGYNDADSSDYYGDATQAGYSNDADAGYYDDAGDGYAADDVDGHTPDDRESDPDKSEPSEGGRSARRSRAERGGDVSTDA